MSGEVAHEAYESRHGGREEQRQRGKATRLQKMACLVSSHTQKEQARGPGAGAASAVLPCWRHGDAGHGSPEAVLRGWRQTGRQ